MGSTGLKWWVGKDSMGLIYLICQQPVIASDLILLTLYEFCLKVAQLMKMLKTMHEHKMKQRRSEMRDRAAKHQKDQAKVDVARSLKRRELKKQVYRKIGKQEVRKKKQQEHSV